MMNFVLLFHGRSLENWRDDVYSPRGHIFEICSRSVRKFVFPELMMNGDDVNETMDGNLVIRRRKYEFKEVMERYMLNGAMIQMRKGKHSEICWTMAQWFSFMDLMGYKEKELNEQCTVVLVKKSDCNVENSCLSYENHLMNLQI